MQLFSADAKLFKRKKKFDHKKLKKLPPKVAQKYSIVFFSPVLPNGPKRRIPISKCGLKNHCL